LLQALIGNKESALSLLNGNDFKSGLAKAQVLINLGRAEEAIKVLDELSKESDLEKWYVFITMSKAFLLNNEPKSS